MSKQKGNTPSEKKVEDKIVFERENYRLMIIGLVVIVVGFILMYGKENIYDFRKITLAPIVVLAGFVIQFIAIMKKPRSNNEHN